MNAMPSMVPDVEACDLKVLAQDDFPLAATLFHPESRPRGAVLICSEVGVRRHFYRHLAQYLAQQDYLVLTFDYRGIGQSRPRTLRGFTASLSQWAEQDMSGALKHLRAHRLPTFWLGHGWGAQAVGLVEGSQHLQGVVSVASGLGGWSQVLGQTRWLAAAMLYGFVPLTTSLLGYVPAQLVGQGQDLPAGVAQELARWGRSPRFFADHLGAHQMEKITRLKLPWLALNFTDDPLASPTAGEQLMALYPQVDLEKSVLRPEQAGQIEIGHYGYFQPRQCGLLWPQVVEFFSRRELHETRS